MPEDRTKRTAIELPMIWYYDLGEWLNATKDHVAALLPSKNEADLAERLDTLSPRDAGQPGHTATT